MIRRRWWSVGMVGILMLAGAVAGYSGDGDHDDGHHVSGGCVLVAEREPNATALTAQFLINVRQRPTLDPSKPQQLPPCV